MQIFVLPTAMFLASLLQKRLFVPAVKTIQGLSALGHNRKITSFPSAAYSLAASVGERQREEWILHSLLHMTHYALLKKPVLSKRRTKTMCLEFTARRTATLWTRQR